MKRNNCIIIAGGEFKEKDIKINEGDFIIAADKGYEYAQKLNLKVDLLIGDFDSLNQIPNDVEIIKLNPIKDDTDSLDAIKEGIKRGYKSFIIYGALGNRLEHSLANLSLMIYLKNQGFAGKIIDNGKIYIVLKDESITLPKRNEGYVSVFSISEKSKGVTLKNLKYELNNYELKNDVPLGIDNEYIGLTPEISVSDGMILVIY